MAETIGKVQPKCYLLDAIDYYIHLESDVNLALDTSYKGLLIYKSKPLDDCYILWTAGTALSNVM